MFTFTRIGCGAKIFYHDQNNGVVGKTILDLVWPEPSLFEFSNVNFCGLWMMRPKFLDRPKFESKSENSERIMSRGTFLGSQHFGG